MSALPYQALAAFLLALAAFCGSPCEANKPPVLTTNKVMIITGTAPVNNSLSGQMKGKDPDNHGFTFTRMSLPDPALIQNVTIRRDGSFEFFNVCPSCTGETSFTVKLTDATGLSNTYTIKVILKDRTTGSFKMVSDNEKSKASHLLRWHIYLIIMAAITVVGVVASLVMYNCCLFETDIYSAPMKRTNKIIDRSDTDRQGDMNPYARQRRMSLIVKEAVRSGAADGTPYYGVRKSGVWVPTAPEDNDRKGQPTPLRLLSISEDPEVARLRSGSIAPVRPSSSRLKPIAEATSLDRTSWKDISAPRR